MCSLLRGLAGSLNGAVTAAWVAHVLAWGVGLWLAFGPVYSGVSATPVQVNPETGQVVGQQNVEVTRHTESLIEANGLGAGLYLLAPLVLTALYALAVHLIGVAWLVRKGIQWVSAIALLAACLLSILSIGVLYLPSVIVLLVGLCFQLPRSGERMGVTEGPASARQE